MEHFPPKLAPKRREWLSLKAALIYALMGSGWIYFSDKLMGTLAADLQSVVRFSLIKGLMYILATAALLFFVIHRGVLRIRRSEEALQETTTRLENTLESISDAFFATDNNVVVTYFNAAAERMLNRKAPEVIGRRLFDAFPEAKGSIFDEKYQEAVAGKVSVAFETYFDVEPYRDWYDVRVYPQKNGVSVYFQIITERKQAEEALRESQARLKIAMDLAKLVYWEYDVKAGMFSFGDQFYALYGATSQHEGGPLMTAEAYAAKFVPPDESHVVAEAIAKALASADPDFTNQLEHRIIRGDGEERHIIVSYGVVCDQTNSVVKIRGANQDITERKRAETALRKSEEMYRTLVSLSPDAISMADPNGLLVFTSPKARQMFGYSPEDEILGLSILSWVAPEEQEKASENIGHLLAEGTLIATEFTLLKKDGASFIGEVNAAVILAPDGNPMRMIIITRDVTERKRAEDALRRSQRQLADIIEFIPDATFVVNNEGTVIAWNRAIEEMTGISKKKMIGRGDFEYSLPFFGSRRPILIDLVSASEERKAEYYDSVSTVGGAIVAETYSPDAYGGKGAYLWGVATALFDEQGNVTGAIESIRDITERKLAENVLRESEEKFFLIFQHCPLMVAISVLEDGTYLDVNDKFMDVGGFTREEVLGKTSIEVGWLRAEDRRRVIEALQRQGKFSGMEITSYAKDGRPIDCLYQCELVTIGGVKRILTMVLDITEHRRAEKERKKLEEQLFQSQKMESVGRLAGGVAHDFNNMLGVIIGRAELAMQQDLPADKLQRNLEEILKAGLRSADLTRQLLAFARKQTAMPRVLDLNDTISGMLKMLKRLIAEDIDLSWRPGLDLWKIKVDPSQVDQILANLVVNASDAISGAGAITMCTGNIVIDASNRAETPEFIPGEYVLLTISDTGEGMSREVRENIFEPFFTTKELGKGTGLGLSTVYGVVKQNEGFIYVVSEPGKGTTFKIYLPRFEAGTAQPPREETPGKPPTGTEAILLVEDDQAMLNLGKMILENLGYTVLGAHAPADAMILAREHTGDLHLLITDVVMPEMNGRELAKQLSAIRPNLKCLYMSGYTADVIAHHGIVDEGLNFIQKPFGADTLAAKVRQVLDH